ncbi:pilin [Shewanella algae]|uniref:pilin n=1 Tax=Shewanella algae TaxID=38313 RepID=UPI0031F5838D
MKGIKLNKRAQGFTLIELMIVVAIIGILAAIALPAYQDYTKKSRFAQINTSADGMKTAVTVCYHDIGTLTGCTAGSNGVPSIPATLPANIKTFTVTNGVITLEAEATAGGYTNVWTASEDATTKQLTWAHTGTCIAAGYCK